MVRYAAALSQHPDAAPAAGEVAGELIDRLGGERPDVAMVFVSPHHREQFGDIVAAIRTIARPDALVAATATAIIGGAQEVEHGPAISLWAADWGGGHAQAMRLRVRHDDDGVRFEGWPETAAPSGTLLVLADPFSFPVGDLLALVNASAPELTVLGGLASAANAPGGNRLALDGATFGDGAVGILLDRDVPVRTVVSQGCRPIGQPFTVTKSERNVVIELAGQPAVERLQSVAASVSEADRDLLRRGLHLGVVVDEHQIDFHRGDFLVRNLLGVHRPTGGLAIGELVDVGQTVQFHVRDAQSAHDDLDIALRRIQARVDSALLFTCNGRGEHLFGAPNHDAELVQAVHGAVPVAGAFCAGEIGPVGGRNFLHGFTASLAVFGDSVISI
jgi:small ligand-binding sensory domain FIST